MESLSLVGFSALVPGEGYSMSVSHTTEGQLISITRYAVSIIVGCRPLGLCMGGGGGGEGALCDEISWTALSKYHLVVLVVTSLSPFSS